MRVRRTAGASFVTAVSAAGLLALAGPALADSPDPAGNPDCFFVTPTPDATDEPSAEPSDQPTDEPTEQVTDEPSGEPTDDVTAEPGETVTPEPGATDDATPDVTDDPTDQATGEPTDEPTGEPTEEPSPDGTPTPYYVCLAYTGPEASGIPPTRGGATVELPFSGAPVGRYAATGLALVVAGSGTVLLARRRAS